MSEPLKSLCIFLPTGHTYTFKNVSLLHDNETGLRFEYTSTLDGGTKEANFLHVQIAGFSVQR